MYKLISYFVVTVIVFLIISIALLLALSEPSIIKSIIRDFYALLLIGFIFSFSILFLIYKLNKKTHQLMLEIEKNKLNDSINVQNLINHQLELSNSLIIAQEGQKAKDIFLANMSHEIRTPLNGIVGFLSLLKDTEVTKTQEEYIDMCNISSKILLTIINDILDFSKMEAGKLELDRQPNRCKFELLKTAQLFEPQIRKKGLNYIIDIDDNLPDCLMCDTNRMKQVLFNIIGNAVKFTQKGEIIFSVKVLSQDEKQATIRYSIKDTGIGIPKEKQALIFEAFSQADKFINGKFGGTGLGVSIARGIIALAGGELKLDSESDKGAEFYFILTIEKCESISPTEHPKEDHYSHNPHEHTILVAEDNTTNQMLIDILLKNRFIDTEIVENGKLAVEEYCKNHRNYDLIFMDIQMPIMNGIDATKEIIKYEKENNIPHTNIVALTANAIKGDKETYFKAGIDNYLPKPIDMKNLDSILHKYLKTNSSSDSTLNREDFNGGDIVTYDVNNVAKEFGVEPKIILGLLKSFFNNFDNKKEALLNACKEKDFATIREISHTLKGSSGSIKLSLIFKLTAKIERFARDNDNNFDFTEGYQSLESFIQDYKDVLNHRNKV